MKKLFLILLSFCLSVILCFGQTDSLSKVYNQKRSVYITDLSHKINATAQITASGNGMELRSDYRLRIRPNETGKIGLRFSHRWLSVGFSVGIRNLQSDKRGETKFLNAVVNTYGRKWGFDAYYLSHKGHYITDNTIADLPSLNNDNIFPLLPKLNTVYSGINAYYIFNHQKYSYRATFIRNEIQKKSAGSFLLMASYSYFSIQSDSNLVPKNARIYFEPSSQIKNGQFNSVSFMPGYAYTWVYKSKYFFTISPSIGLMSQIQNYGLANESSVRNITWVYPRGMARAGLGYNSVNWYWGFSAIVDNYIINLPQKNLLIYNIGNAHFYLGYRFNVPKKFRRISNTIDHYAPEKIVDGIIR